VRSRRENSELCVREAVPVLEKKRPLKAAGIASDAGVTDRDFSIRQDLPRVRIREKVYLPVA
jgi:hypothetical protein